MNTNLRRLMESKNLGMIVFDKYFNIVETNQIAEDILSTAGQSESIGPRENVMNAFPEFIGSGQFIQNMLSSKIDEFHLEYVNRLDEKGQLRYFDLLVLPDEESDNGFVVIEDVTAQALYLQEKNQQKYDLFLFKHSSTFRRKYQSLSILGESEAIQQVKKTIHKLCKVPLTTILLMGETGTGKNLAAQVIHECSTPPDAPFVDINCAALPEHLIESELFGYEKGAFTHATTSRPGLLEEAKGGTILLDEIGELSYNLQIKLLSVLETKKFRRLGSNKSIEVKSRIISATNRDLQKAVKEKNFREDLYYRLNVVSLYLPPLREMGEDIKIIADYLRKIFNIELKKQVNGFSEDVWQDLLDYSWPGNVRELSNCIERTMIFIEKNQIQPEDLNIPAQMHTQEPRQWTLPPNGIALEDVERQLIVSALEQSGNNKSKAARLLGLTRDTLRYRLDKYQLG